MIVEVKMTEQKQKKGREEMRFDREAKALQKNLEKRKEQQKKRDKLKNEKNKED